MPTLNEVAERWVLRERIRNAISELRDKYDKNGNEKSDGDDGNEVIHEELDVIVEDYVAYEQDEGDFYINIDEDSEADEYSYKGVMTLVTEICKLILKSSNKITHLFINGTVSTNFKHLLNNLPNIQGASNSLEIEDVRTPVESLKTQFPMIIMNQRGLKKLFFGGNVWDNLSAIIAALRSQAKSLVELKIEYFTICDMTTVEHLIQCTSLQKLDIMIDLNIYSNSMFFKMLAACKFKNLQNLRIFWISYNEEKIQVAEDLEIFFENCGKSLKELDLEYHSYEENVQILETLRRNCPQLESLSFPLGGNEEIKEFLKLVIELKFLKNLVLGKTRSEIEADEFFLDFVEIWANSSISYLSANWIISDLTLNEFLEDYIIPIRKLEYLCEEDSYESHKSNLISYSRKLRRKGLIKTL
ncbi:925_t:CDS:2, partial [Acaulospora colombiana]